MQYVTECFSNHSLFHKALKEAFETFCNKPVGQSTSAELMASFCDNLLKKVLPRQGCIAWPKHGGCPSWALGYLLGFIG